MKTLVKSTAILLAALFMLSLAACGSSIVGTWRYQIRLQELLERQAAASSGDEAAMYATISSAMDGVSVDIYFEFDAEGGCKYYADEASGEQAKEKIAENLVGVLPDLFDSFGIGRENLDTYLQSVDMTREEMAAKLAESFVTSDLTEMSYTSTYQVEDDKLYLDGKTDEYIVYTFKGGRLIFSELVGGEDAGEDLPEWLFPMTFDKVR